MTARSDISKDQQRAAHAWTQVKRAHRTKADADAFKKATDDLGIRARISGVPSALQFLEEDSDCATLVQAVEDWIREAVPDPEPGRRLSERVISSPASFARVLADEVTEYAIWLKLMTRIKARSAGASQ